MEPNKLFCDTGPTLIPNSVNASFNGASIKLFPLLYMSILMERPDTVSEPLSLSAPCASPHTILPSSLVIPVTPFGTWYLLNIRLLTSLTAAALASVDFSSARNLSN